MLVQLGESARHQNLECKFTQISQVHFFANIIPRLAQKCTCNCLDDLEVVLFLIHIGWFRKDGFMLEHPF